MTLTLSQDEFRGLCAKLRGLIAEGKEQDEIATELGVSMTEFGDLMRKFNDTEADLLRGRTTEEVYVNYTLRQSQNIKDLTDLIATVKLDGKGRNSVVGAVRARADILDKIIAKGQEFGFIEKKPETKLIAGVIVGQLTTPELRKAVVRELGHLDKIMAQFGDAPNILDVDPGPAHLPTPKQKALPEGHVAQAEELRAAPLRKKKVKGRARNRVHKGRKASPAPDTSLFGEPPD
jgi:hypothetical protein